ncbi:glycosyltransferase [Haladaptatus sp. F3-133]|uniref:Glycosyltransferase n=1 Tax=Halorutilus salinus TaxID=2487751 RepID=A0A9Q4GJQ1_9EURY|nr:glycosyltransferase [Halorutilus salinus]
MTPAKEDVTVLVPTYNEEPTVGDVVRGFTEQGYDVLVTDGGSDDDTQAVAEEAGARVVEQSGSGKGQAVREAIAEHLQKPYVVMIDGDGTYLPGEVDRVLAPLDKGADHVLGNRLGNPDAFTRLNYVGNRIFNAEFAVAHGEYLGDILTGYRAFTLDSARELDLTEDGFGIETEICAEAVGAGHSVEKVGITYRERPEGSEENLHPVLDGGRIGYVVYTTTRRTRPSFFYGSIVLAFAVLVLVTYTVLQ